MNTSPSQTKKLIAAAIIEKDGKILIAQRAKNDGLCGKWEFPGGKVKAGETLQDCLKRELREELGISAEVGDYYCSSSFYHKDALFEMYMFKVPSFEGQIVLHEHSAIAWVSISELSNYDMPDPDLPVVKKLQQLEAKLYKA